MVADAAVADTLPVLSLRQSDTVFEPSVDVSWCNSAGVNGTYGLAAEQSASAPLASTMDTVSVDAPAMSAVTSRLVVAVAPPLSVNAVRVGRLGSR